MTSKRRCLISAGVLVACVCIALGVLAMLPPCRGVTKAYFDRIEDRMTKAEIELILGKSTGATRGGGSLSTCEQYEYYWQSIEGCAFTCFAKKPNDEYANIGPPGPNNCIKRKDWQTGETFSEKLRRWLHLPPKE